MTSSISEPDTTTAFREAARAFGQRYDYDVSYMEALLDASPGAYAAFAGGMGLSHYRHAAPPELLSIAKIAALRVEDCGPCLELALKLGREAGVPEPILLGALHGGRGLSEEHRQIHDYARAVAANEPLDPATIPALEERWGREVLAELAVAIAGVRIYPTIKRALGFAKSCSLMPALA